MTGWRRLQAAARRLRAELLAVSHAARDPQTPGLPALWPCWCWRTP
ncbi:hypothetical protein ACFSC4_02205 [Deinococcus malanensis]